MVKRKPQGGKVPRGAERLEVIATVGAGPYMILPEARLKAVVAALTAAKIEFEVDAEYLSVDDEPEVAFINFDEDSDPKAIQRVLDTVP